MSEKKFCPSIYKHDKLDKAFDNLHGIIDFVGEMVSENITSLQNQVSVAPIQQLEPLLIRGVSVDTYSGSSWCDSEKFRVHISEEIYKAFKDNQVVKDMKFDNKHFGSGYVATFSINESFMEYVTQFIDLIKSHDEDVHTNNLSAVENNKKSKQALLDLMKRVGIREQYLDYKSKRSRTKEWLCYSWVSEIGNQFPTGWYESTLNSEYESKLNSIKNTVNAKLEAIRKEKKAKEEEENRKRNERELALYLGKYGLDIAGTWNDVLDALIEKNKYLRLAHYLQMNRNDWNDGSWYAECGLEGFAIETDEDQKIYDDINQYISDWDGDGRVFRDCEYNYSVLYGMVEDESLMEDYNLVCGKVSY